MRDSSGIHEFINSSRDRILRARPYIADPDRSVKPRLAPARDLGHLLLLIRHPLIWNNVQMIGCLDAFSRWDVLCIQAVLIFFLRSFRDFRCVLAGRSRHGNHLALHRLRVRGRCAARGTATDLLFVSKNRNCHPEMTSISKEVRRGIARIWRPRRQGGPAPVPVSQVGRHGTTEEPVVDCQGSFSGSTQRIGGESRMKRFIYVALLALAVLALVTPPAMAQEEKPFKIHGEVRWRGEYQDNASDFDKNTHDDADFWPYRVRIAAEGQFAHNVSAWIEFQNAGINGGSGNPVKFGGSDVFVGDGATLYQGNVTFNQL